ncbi:MAG: UDP-N-acetylmuramoyl-L-alanyl-D-glutamate--2,6-diaminopimelate ligase, partial [Sphingomonadaceae bacterium]
LAREGVTHVAYAASRHGLSQYRNEGIPVEAAGFTNFSRDHLDYHADMEDYFAAKMRLFDEVISDGATAIVWMGAGDSGWNARVVDRALKRGLKVMTVGEQGEDIHLTRREPTQLGQSLTVEHEGIERTINLPLIGAYQVSNALVSAGLALASGIDASRVWDAVARLQPVRGRLERAVIAPSGAPVYIDYAHTPDALEAAIAALRPHVAGRLITVFGAGGDRDHGKRAPMGEAAAKASDLVIVTDDNPRGEDAAEIRRQVLEGAGDAREVAGRREAIHAAIAEAGKDDIVLVAGKGHETGQIIGSGENMRVHPFDDVEVARECAAQIARGDA